MKNYTRNITTQERTKAKSSHLKILLAVLVCGCIGYVAWHFPLDFKYKLAASIILPGVVLIFTKVQFTIAREIQIGNVQVFEGTILQKFTMGDSLSSKGDKKGNGVSRTKTYYVRFEEIKIKVTATQYRNVEVGMYARLVILPKSKHVLSLEELKE